MYTPTTQDVEKAREHVRQLLHSQIMGAAVPDSAIQARSEEVCQLARLCQASRDRQVGKVPARS
jgi:hypothetical protein